jgi:HEAT repeat protein
MGRKSELAVPALLRALDSPSGLTATAAASALGSFPDQREVIVPALMAVLNQTNSNISRWGPANALNRLDPAVAGKAGLNR